MALCAVAGVAGCHSVVDPPLPAGAVRLTPPAVYAPWWAAVEACSGLTRELRAVAWYVLPGADLVGTGGAAPDGATSYYSAAGDRVVLAGAWQFDGGVVRHEMLHALLRGQHGHPRAQFLGRCAGVVRCEGGCLSDAGPAPAPPADAHVVPPSALVVGAELSPASPSASRNDGWFTLTVTATNPAPTPVVALALAGAPVSFSYEVGGTPGQPTSGGSVYIHDEFSQDASTAQFRAGETKRFVFDLRVARDTADADGRGSFRPGPSVFRGAFGGRTGGAWSSPVAATLFP